MAKGYSRKSRRYRETSQGPDARPFAKSASRTACFRCARLVMDPDTHQVMEYVLEEIPRHRASR
jgi:hypothetical protein